MFVLNIFWNILRIVRLGPWSSLRGKSGHSKQTGKAKRDFLDEVAVIRCRAREH